MPFVAFLEGSLYVFVVLALLAPRFLTHWFTILFGRHGLVGDVLPDVVLLVAASLPVASLVGVILHGNDMRDIATDKAAGICTTASRLGPLGALVLYGTLHAVPHLFCVAMCVLRLLDEYRPPAFPWLIPLLVLPLTIRTLAKAVSVYRADPADPPWRGLERASGGIHCLFGILYALSIALGA